MYNAITFILQRLKRSIAVRRKNKDRRTVLNLTESVYRVNLSCYSDFKPVRQVADLLEKYSSCHLSLHQNPNERIKAYSTDMQSSYDILSATMSNLDDYTGVNKIALRPVGSYEFFYGRIDTNKEVIKAYIKVLRAMLSYIEENKGTHQADILNQKLPDVYTFSLHLLCCLMRLKVSAEKVISIYETNV